MECPDMEGTYEDHWIMETLELEGTHEGHQVQLLAKDNPENPTDPQTKHSLTSGTMESPKWEETRKDHQVPSLGLPRHPKIPPSPRELCPNTPGALSASGL